MKMARRKSDDDGWECVEVKSNDDVPLTRSQKELKEEIGDRFVERRVRVIW